MLCIIRKGDAVGTKRYREEGAATDSEAVVRAGPSYSQDDESDEFIAACNDRLLEVTNAHAKAQSKKLDQGQETWAAPWETEKPQHVAPHKAVTIKEASDAVVLKARTVDDGIFPLISAFHSRFFCCFNRRSLNHWVHASSSHFHFPYMVYSFSVLLIDFYFYFSHILR